MNYGQGSLGVTNRNAPNTGGGGDQFFLLAATQEFIDNSAQVPVNFPVVALAAGTYVIEVEIYITQTISALVAAARMLLEFSGVYGVWNIEYDYRSLDLTISDVHTTDVNGPFAKPVTDIFNAVFPAPNQTEANIVLKAKSIIEVTDAGNFSVQAGLDANEGNTGWFLKNSFIRVSTIQP